MGQRSPVINNKQRPDVAVRPKLPSISEKQSEEEKDISGSSINEKIDVQNNAKLSDNASSVQSPKTPISEDLRLPYRLGMRKMKAPCKSFNSESNKQTPLINSARSELNRSKSQNYENQVEKL